MSEHILNVSIVTPHSKAFEGAALSVSVPGSQSPFQVLVNHAPIISSLDIGVLKIEDDKNYVSFFAIREGFVEVLHNTVTIVVQDLIAAKDIDVAKAEVDLEDAHTRADSAPDRSMREIARKDVHWAEARLRSARLAKERA